jgi:hypothetical protein
MAKKTDSTLLIIIGSIILLMLLVYLIPMLSQNTTVYSTTVNDTTRPRHNRSSYNYMYSHGNSPGERANWFGPGGMQHTHPSGGHVHGH